jgi:hypothetical protein
MEIELAGDVRVRVDAAVDEAALDHDEFSWNQPSSSCLPQHASSFRAREHCCQSEKAPD